MWFILKNVARIPERVIAGLGLRCVELRERASSRNGTVDKAMRVAAYQGKFSARARVNPERAESATRLFLCSAALSAAYTPHWVVVVLSAGLLLTFCSPCAPL